MSRVVLLAFAVALVALPAHARKAFDRLLVDGARCYEQLNYGCAISKLRQASARMEAQSLAIEPEVALQLFQTLAFALAAVERHDEATEAFGRCFAVRGTYRLDPVVISPKIYGDFEAARRRYVTTLLDVTLRPPPLPPVHGPPPPQPTEYRLHVPTLLSPGDVGPGATRHEVDVLVGGMLLFDEPERFGPGVGFAVRYSFAALPRLDLQVVLQLYQHQYTGGDLLDGYPGTLFVFAPGVGVAWRQPLGQWVELAAGVLGGVSLFGVGNISDRAGGFVAFTATATATVHPQFGVGFSAMPMFTLSSSGASSLASSFSLPLLGRVLLRF